MRNYLKLGDWNALCDVCGFKFKASDLHKRWDGLMVCSDDYETRHPQDLLRVPRESVDVPWVRIDPDESFVSIARSTDITTETGIAITIEDPLIALLIEDTSQAFIMTQDFDFFTTENDYLLEQE